MSELCDICGSHVWAHKHHRKRRSQGGTDDPANIMRLCLFCHEAVHSDPSTAYEKGWLVKSWDEVRPLQDPGAESPSVAAPGKIGDHAASGVEESSRPGATSVNAKEPIGSVAPGDSCPTCHRRVPHPHKKDSPKTKVFSTRVPVDDAVTFHDMLEATAHHLELHNKPHWAYWTLLHSMVLALQTPHA